MQEGGVGDEEEYKNNKRRKRGERRRKGKYINEKLKRSMEMPSFSVVFITLIRFSETPYTPLYGLFSYIRNIVAFVFYQGCQKSAVF